MKKPFSYIENFFNVFYSALFICLQGQGGSGPFDEADDCTVPSTPTLYEPKRSDGFAEAVRYGIKIYPVLIM